MIFWKTNTRETSKPKMVPVVKINKIIRPLIIGLISFLLLDNTPIWGQEVKKTTSISVKESYKLLTDNKYVADLINYKYTDSTITKFIKLNEPIEKGQSYYEYWIYQEQPKLQKISKLLILRIDKISKVISVYDPETDSIVPLNKWIASVKL